MSTEEKEEKYIYLFRIRKEDFPLFAKYCFFTLALLGGGLLLTVVLLALL